MFITNTKTCDFVIYSSKDDDCYIIHVPYNKTLVLNEYIPKLQYIYFTHMLRYLSEENEM